MFSGCFLDFLDVFCFFEGFVNFFLGVFRLFSRFSRCFLVFQGACRFFLGVFGCFLEFLEF